MSKVKDFTDGKIFSPLVKFIISIFAALFLQTMYGAVDLLIVGRFGNAADVSDVSTGSQIMQVITLTITGLAMGITILIGQKLGQGKKKYAGNVVGSGISIFVVIAIILTVVFVTFAPSVASFMNAPAEAFDGTSTYIRICCAGAVFIVAYNLIGGIFRGLGDAKTPLMTVFIACVANILGDLVFVGIFNMAAAGAALATVLAQAISVILSLIIIAKRGLPFEFSLKSIKFHKGLTSQIIKFGAPIALQELLVQISFLVIVMIGNAMGIVPSAGMGVAQNYGAGKYDRAKKALLCAIGTSLCCGVCMFFLAFFKGDILASIFSTDHEVILAAWDYLKSYAIDCFFTAFLFCMIGFLNGCGKTTIVMIQGIVGAFLVRIPVAYVMSKIEPVSLFRVGLATPSSTIVQIIICGVYLFFLSKTLFKKEETTDAPNHELCDAEA